MKTLMFVLRILFLLLVLLLGTVAFILQHDGASKTLITLTIKFLPGLSVKDISGNFLQGLTLTELRYEKPDLDITLEKGEIQLNILSLLLMRVVISHIDAHDLTITLTKNEQKESASELPRLQLPFGIDVQKLVLQNGLLDVDGWQLPVQLIQLGANMQDGHLFLHDATLSNDDIHLTIDGDLRFNGAWPVNAAVAWKITLPEVIASLVNDKHASGTALISGSIEQLHIREKVEYPLQVEGDIHIQTMLKPLHIAIQQQWQPAQITLAEQQWQLGEGDITLAGNLDNYQGTVNTRAQLLPWPELTLTLLAQGNQKQLTIEHLQAVYSNVSLNNASSSKQQTSNTAKIAGKNDTTVTAQGALMWQPEIAWQLKGQVQQIDPALLHPEFPGALNFNIASAGTYTDELALQIALDDITGELRGSTIQGYSHTQWRNLADFSTDTQINIASNLITLKGKIAQQLDMQLQVDGQELTGLLPGLAGNMTLNAYLTGAKDKPLLNANLEAENLHYQEFSLANLGLTLTAENPRDNTMQLDISGKDLQYGKQPLLSRMALGGTGSLHKDLMHWQLQHLSLENELTGKWNLQDIANLTFEKQTMSIMPICLHNQSSQSRLCIDAQGDPKNGNANLTLSNFPLSPLASFIDQQSAQITGQVNATASAQLINGELAAQLSVDGSEGILSWLDNGQENHRINWHKVKLDATVKDQQLLSSWQWLFKNNDRISGELNGGMTGDFPLQGQVIVQFDNLQWLELLLPVNQVQGNLHGHVNIAGTLKQPEYDVNMSLEKGFMHIIDAGINLENIDINGSSTSNTEIALKGSLNSGSGKLLMNGNIKTETPWLVSINLQGRDVLAIDRGDAVIKVNPDIQLTIVDQLIQLRGKVVVTEAVLKVRELPKQAVRLSHDVKQLDSEVDESAWQIDNDIVIVLGDNVKFDGFGLVANFKGDIRIEDKPQLPLSLTGNVNIIDGRYRAYGVNLRVERGNLYFQGQPDNPGLDILAVRTIQSTNTKVGLEIGGTLQNPQSNVFSQPLVEETEAMALLLTGKPLANASQRDGNAILQAIVVYGINQGDFISEQVGKSLGIEVGFDNEGENDKTALMLGKQLSSKLFISYSVGIFESISTIKLRYRLNQDFSLETQTNAQTESIDLLYRKER